MKHGEPQEEDYKVADKLLKNLHYLWMQAKFKFTPKVHRLLNHTVHQMRHYKGIGDTLEVDVERIHQISAEIEPRVTRMKNKAQQAVVHSKMEAIHNCNLVKDTIEASQLLSKRVFKKGNIELCAQERG
jgi:DNA repair protein RadC